MSREHEWVDGEGGALFVPQVGATCRAEALDECLGRFLHPRIQPGEVDRRQKLRDWLQPTFGAAHGGVVLLECFRPDLIVTFDKACASSVRLRETPRFNGFLESVSRIPVYIKRCIGLN